MLKLPSLFKPVYYKRYSYKPRYYDEEKEKREQRKKELENYQPDANENFRQYARKRWSKERRAQQKQSNARLIGIIFILLFLSWLLVRNLF